ncbi:MAG TPA: hypothetical protein EYP85_06870 [Armatimonadetes bacterium]|nr:hypothetical protein [Armatimonadota bacterium]
MGRNCACSGYCAQRGVELNRREFLQMVAFGAASLALARGWRRETPAAKPLSTPSPGAWGDYPLTPPRRYTGEHLEYVLMPLGGIGTGTIWLDGQGRLAVWQIFNNFTEVRLPHSFFALRVQPEGKRPQVRVLQTVEEPGFPPLASLTYEGGYPLARLDFEAPDLPVAVRLEGFNPMIPLDPANSSLPCALFRLTVTNRSGGPLEVALLGTLQNAVGSQGQPGIEGTRFAAYGRNRNRLLRTPRGTLVRMEQVRIPPESGPLKVRSASGAEVSGPPLLWLETLHGPLRTAESGQATGLFVTVHRLSGEGGGGVIGEARPDFWEAVLQARRQEGEWARVVVFEDFEKGTYEGWTVEGTAFGDAPHTGTTPGQQPVSGFLGQRLVNTFRPNDRPQGTLTSRPFRIQHRYLGFLIGGGKHPGETCINLLVDGKVVRTATGQNRERLEPHAWDVSEFVGQEAVLQIVDRHSGGWGHINLDHIVFADAPPDRLLRLKGPFSEFAAALPVAFAGVEWVELPQPQQVRLTGAGRRLLGEGAEEWRIREYTRLLGFRLTEGVQVLAKTEDGEPVLLACKIGQAQWALGLAPNLPWSWAEPLLVTARGKPLKEGERLVTASPRYGTMCLAVDTPASGTARWSDPMALAAAFRTGGQLDGPTDSGLSPEGETYNAALSVPFRLRPGESRTVTFAITWHFPNLDRFGHPGNLYSRRFPEAEAVARYVLENLPALWGWTECYHTTVYQSNLPPALLDAFTSQSVIFRGPTCFWSEDGYFGGFEGSYGCCPLNCTHVWNYAQTHARLFPEIGRNMRESDLLVYLHPDGETSHRQHRPHRAFVDGHCATIEAAYREHLLSPDHSFLKRVWPNLKKAMNWLIQHFDPDEDGVLNGHQWNTYDCATSGATTFLGSQYLSALGAAERMAEVMDETEAAARYRRIREAGSRNQSERLWNGEYFVQIPGDPPAHDYNTGCHSDQLLGQWWAHQLNLGYLYPPEQVRSALRAIFRYNFRPNFRGFQQRPRRYVLDDEGGLLMCTWPQGGRPNPFIIYADEVWTGIEYEVAGLMIWEGLIEEALRLVETARSRYDGRRREGLNSGPGGNPFNELECGKFYARAMSSGGLLLAAQGFILDGPAGVLGFEPRWQPEDHRSFYTAPEGWGLFVQRREGRAQRERIEVRYGRLRVRELIFAVPEKAGTVMATAQVEGRRLNATIRREGTEVRLLLDDWVEVLEGSALEVTLRW